MSAYKLYLNQNYQDIKNACLSQQGSLFEDDKFPASKSSLGKYKTPSTNVTWKRPHEIVENPQRF